MSTVEQLGEALQKHLKEDHFQGSENGQKEAWQRFLVGSLPNQNHEHFRYVRLRDLYSSTFSSPAFSSSIQAPAILTECEGSVLVLINGVYQPTYSSTPEPLIALPLSDAFKTYHGFLSNRWKTWVEEEKDPFALLNGALYNRGLFLYLPPKKVLEKPIHILNIVTGNGIFNPRIHFFGGKESSCKVYFTQQGSSGKVWINSLCDFTLEEKARVTCTTVLNADSAHFHTDAIRAQLKRESHFKSIAMTGAGALVRQDYSLSLMGEQAEAELYGISVLSGSKQAHTHVLMNHTQPHCHSLQKFKSVLSGHSRSSFEGKIYVHENAQKTEAYQRNNNLILSKQASANSKPNLEIFADDVKASHGATVGQLDEEQLFYLKSRGIESALAKKMLVDGFSSDIVDLIELPSLRKLLPTLLHNEID